MEQAHFIQYNLCKKADVTTSIHSKWFTVFDNNKPVVGKWTDFVGELGANANKWFPEYF